MLLAVVGPTGSGKSTTALAVAERLAGAVEIVAVDAFTIYRGMDIGTAKPSQRVRDRVPHHMIDLLDPAEDGSVEWFQERARAAVDLVRERGKTPVLVGGSGLYFRAVVDDLRFPPTDAAVRARIERRFDGDPSAAHAALAVVDPASAERIEPGNLRRSVRALEVIELTGQPFSRWRRGWDDYRSIYADLRVVGIERPQPELVDRIHTRVDDMIAAGWLDEARALAASPLSATARKALGYGELLAHLEGRLTLDEAVGRIKARTRRYAASQRRWFRADARVRWADAHDAEQVIEQELRAAP